jgi:phosphonatase-like hydrolase
MTVRLRPQLAVLDMAGTTVAVTDVVPAVWRASFQRFGLELSDAALAGVRGKSKRSAALELLDHAGGASALADDVYDAFQRELNVQLTNGVVPIPGAARAISELRALCGRVVLITGFDRATTDRIMLALDWKNLVDAVVCSDEVREGRPAPDLIHQAMQISACTDPARVLVAGDTVADLQAAANAQAGWIAGVLSGAHTREQLSQHRHDALLDSVADLPRWVAERI